MVEPEAEQPDKTVKPTMVIILVQVAHKTPAVAATVVLEVL
jgi:hypothetical protein